MNKMCENLSKVLNYIRGCAKGQAYDDVLAQRNNSTCKTDYKTLAKGAIAALVHMGILTDDDSIMVLSEFERVREIERKRYGEWCEKYAR